MLSIYYPTVGTKNQAFHEPACSKLKSATKLASPNYGINHKISGWQEERYKNDIEC
jgi:hypothetical protein